MMIKRIALLCIGLYSLGCTTTQKNQSLDKEEALSLKIASYNLRMDTPDDGPNAWPHRKEAVAALLSYHGLDIIGTQEGFLHQLKDLCTDASGYAYFGGGRDDGLQAGEHSAVLYKKDRFEVVESGNFWLNETPDKPGLGWDATCCFRICSWARMKEKHSGKEFYVFNTHFDHRGVKAREESAKLMAKKIGEIARQMPVICTGDFNSTPDARYMGYLTYVLRDAYNASEQLPYGPEGTFNGFDWEASLKERIDYIFLSGQFRVLRYAHLTDSKDQRYPSDHLPVVADLLLMPDFTKR